MEQRRVVVQLNAPHRAHIVHWFNRSWCAAITPIRAASNDHFSDAPRTESVATFIPIVGKCKSFFYSNEIKFYDKKISSKSTRGKERMINCSIILTWLREADRRWSIIRTCDIALRWIQRARQCVESNCGGLHISIKITPRVSTHIAQYL